MKKTNWKYFALAAMLSSSSLLSAATYNELRSDAEAKMKAGAYKESVAVWQQMLDATDATPGGKVFAADKLGWVYAWQVKDFGKAVETMIKVANTPGLSSKEIYSCRIKAIDYLMRMTPPEREKSIQLLHECLKIVDLSTEDRAGTLSRMANLLNETEPAKADALVEQALNLDLNITQRNRVRREAADMKKNRNNFEYEKSANYNMMIVNDVENTPKVKCDALLNIASTYAAGKTPDYTKANAMLDKVMVMPEVDAEQKARAALQKADYAMRGKIPDLSMAIATYGKVVEDGALTNFGMRMDAFEKMFNLMQRKQTPRAEILAAFERMGKLPLKGNDLRKFSELFGRYLMSIDDYAQAEKVYRNYAQAENNENSARQLNIWMGDLESRRNNEDKSVEFFRQAKDFGAAGSVLFKAGRIDEANKIWLEGMKANANPDQVMDKMIHFNDVAQLGKLLGNELKPILAENPTYARKFEGKIKSAMECGGYDFVSAIAPAVIENAKDKAPSQIIYYLINSQAMLGNKAEAAKLIDAAVSNSKISEVPFQFRFRVMQTALKAKDRASGAAAVSKVIGDFKSKFEKVDQIPTEMNKAAMSMVMLNNRTAAEAIEEARAKLYSAMPNKRAEVKFVNNLPENVSGWMLTDMVKNRQGALKLDRQLWGANVEFMLATDVAVKRDVTGGKDAQGIDTDMYFACDDKAFYVFVVAFDNNAGKFENGFASGGSYEIYMAPGELQPYYCTLINITNGKADSFYSNYRNEYSRAPRTNSGLLAETKVVAPNATATLLTYPWEMFYNMLPDGKGSAWQFDLMRWSGPGSSWNGTVSVHNRSTYGDVVFNFTPEQLSAIRRNIVFKARQAYNDFQGSKWRGTGIFDFWSNPVIGDVAFYENKVLPLKNQLDAAVKEITPEMDDAAVNRIYLEYADKLFNLDFEIAKLRSEYLETQNFTE